MSVTLPIGPAPRIAGPYTATAGQTSFSFAFALIEAGDLVVETAPAADPENWTAATFGTEWTLPTALPTVAGGNIVFALGRTAGTRVRIVGAAVIANTQDPLPAGKVDSTLLNRWFDRTTIWAQEARRDIGSALALLKTSANGWTPIEAVESYGERRVRKIIDWVGGLGAKPAINRYVGTAGLTANIAQAVDIRGAAGAGVKIIGTVATVEELPTSGSAGDAWVVDENLYVWSAVSESWTNLGPLMEGTLETSNHIGLTNVAVDDRNIPAPVVNIATSGHANPGDGGHALWRSVDTEPAHPGKRPSLFGRWWELYNNVYTPQHFGVFDDAGLTIDQSARLQDWLDACAYTGRAPHVERPLRVLSQEPLAYVPGANVPGLIKLARMKLHFDFDGGLSVGEVGRGMYGCEFFAPSITRRGAISWLDDERASRLSNNAGLIFYNPVGCSLHVLNVYGFTSGYILHSEDWWAAYNSIYVGLLQDNRYAEVLRTIAGDFPGREFANENTVFGGARRSTSSTNLLGNAYGTVLTASDAGYKGNNTNRFLGSCYELGSPASATHRVPVLLDRSGVYNLWEYPRHESGKGPFGIADNGSGITTNAACLNRVKLLYEAGLDPTNGFYAGWLQVAGAFGNVCEHAINSPQAVWHSGPMASKVSSGGTANPKIEAPFFIKRSASSAVLRSGTSSGDIIANADCLQIGSSVGVFVEVDTRKTKTFRLTGAFLPDFGGRYAIQAFGTPPAWSGGRTVSIGMHTTNDGGKVYVCDQGGLTDVSGGPTGTGTNITDGTARWDYAGVLADFADGAPLVGLATDGWGTEQYVKGATQAVSLFGGGYQPSADNATNVIFTVREEITRVHIGYAGATNPCALRDMSIQAFPVAATLAGVGNAYQTVNLGDPLPASPTRFRTATAKPDTSGLHGFYGDGEFVGAAGATTGTTPGWIVSPGGALAAAWVGDMDYAVPGRCVVNDGDKVYRLRQPGMSAASGGPTGTGKGIADNTCVWDYLCLKAAFIELAPLP